MNLNHLILNCDFQSNFIYITSELAKPGNREIYEITMLPQVFFSFLSFHVHSSKLSFFPSLLQLDVDTATVAPTCRLLL